MNSDQFLSGPDNEESNGRLSLISHKLRTPLTVIISTVNNFLDGAFGHITEEQRKWLQKLEHHTSTLEQLLHEILDLLQTSVRMGGGKIMERTQAVLSHVSTGTPDFPEFSPSSLFNWNRVPKILVVDDEPDIRETIREGMEMKGFQVFSASEGGAALALALEHQPDLILMDVHLKDQNGMAVCHQIKSRMKTFVPVLLVTGQEQLASQITGDKNGPDDLLTKPFQMAELSSRVNSMLRLKKLYDDLERAVQKNNSTPEDEQIPEERK